MKKILIPVLMCLTVIKAFSQEQSRVITTAVPFMLIAGDPRAAGMGDIGVTTSPDAFSQQWNPAKFAFSTSNQGVGVTYTPYLSKLVNDVFLGNLTYFNRINERSAVGASFRYFSTGEIELRQTPDESGLKVKPNEMLFDVSYALRLSDRFSMAVAGRYIRSDLKLVYDNDDSGAGNTFAVDIAGYYQSEEIAFDEFNGRWRGGFNISNIGPKLKYDAVGQENYIPTNLAVGAGFDFILDEFNTIGVSLEFNKLLVPTPSDSNGDGKINMEDDYYNKNFFSGMFSSFGDAPGGLSEELKEITWALGAEYWYEDVFALRAGYFNESEEKGSRKFASFGAGFRYTSINIDMSYLFSTSKIPSPLEGTLRFGLTFNFGGSTVED
ncbi:MAG TPA: type IX secretion system outer membrane channel protein PorV [Flavobacteriaceae bacterium]|nr:type IX secretion system outer membrane channel protein PorV [Flavobacteriaceae bacterium]